MRDAQLHETYGISHRVLDRFCVPVSQLIMILFISIISGDPAATMGGSLRQIRRLGFHEFSDRGSSGSWDT